MNQIKRRASRIKRRMSASFEAGGKVFRGIVSNFSEFGMFLQTSSLLKLHTPVTVRVPVSPTSELLLRGRVCSKQNDLPLGIGGRVGGLGVMLDDTPPDYLTFVRDKRS